MGDHPLMRAIYPSFTLPRIKNDLGHGDLQNASKLYRYFLKINKKTSQNIQKHSHSKTFKNIQKHPKPPNNTKKHEVYHQLSLIFLHHLDPSGEVTVLLP